MGWVFLVSFLLGAAKVRWYYKKSRTEGNFKGDLFPRVDFSMIKVITGRLQVSGVIIIFGAMRGGFFEWNGAQLIRMVSEVYKDG